MSHERSTPSTPGSEDFAAAPLPPPSAAQPFARTPSNFQRENGNTPFEEWARGRSDDSFRALAGAAGGFTSGIVTCPLDVIKTKLQAQGGFRPRTNGVPSHVVYRGLIGTGKVIWREEGLRGMYRGLGPIILGYLPTWAVYFTVYGRSKVFFANHVGMDCGSFIDSICMLTFTRKYLRHQLLFISCRWGVLHIGHQPYLGNKDPIDVPSEQESNFE